MNRATERAQLRANDHAVDDRTAGIGKVLTVSAIVASSTITGAQSGVLDDHAARRTAVSLATEVRTLKGSVPWSIDATLNGAVCGAASGNTCTNLQYPEVTGDIGVIVGENLLDKALDAASTPQIIFGYSAGAVVASRWLSEHASEADAPSADNVSFIFIGNPKRKYGGSTTEYTSTPTTPNTQYTVLDISREYDDGAKGRLKVLDGVSLSVAQGEFVAIVGDSGVGKSTLLNCLAGLDRWDAGQVLHQGVDLGRQVFAVGVGEFGTKLADEFQGRAHGVTLSLVVR